MSDDVPGLGQRRADRDADEPAIAALDHGVTVGDGAFETAKVDRGQVFAATRHARRLDRTLAGLGLPPADHDHIAEGIKAVLEAGDPIEFGRLRYSVTGGAGPLGSDRRRPPADLHRDRRLPAPATGERRAWRSCRGCATSAAPWPG